MRTIRPKTTDRPVFNPGMGLYLAGGSGMGYEPSQDAWIFEMADIVYFRPVWGDLEETGPGSGFDEYFQPIFDFWVKKLGKRVAFRVMSESMHSGREYATPKWIFDAGVPSVRHVGLRAKNQCDPVFWNAKYLDLYCQFTARLGKYLNGHAGLEYIDIGGIGEWGEMHLGLHIPGRWTAEQLEETGFTRSKYIAAYRRIIDAHAKAFPNTRVFLNVGDYPQVNDFAATRGMHFRQDGLTPAGPSANVGNLFFRPYAPRGVVCNYEFHSGLSSMRRKGWDLKTTVDKGLSDPISYMNTNVLGMPQWEQAPQEVKNTFIAAARKIGFRFVLVQANVQQQIRVRDDRPSRLIMTHRWQNTGIAPCYESYALEFTLHDKKGSVIASELYFPRVPTTRWEPGSMIDLQSVIKIPESMPAGTYQLKVAMILPEQHHRPIQLGIAGADTEGRYPLCELPAVPIPNAALDTWKEGFETAKTSWKARPGVAMTVDRHERHSGNSSLHIEGTQTEGWNHAAGPQEMPIFPGSKYRLTCWIKVDQLEPESLPPYLKLGIHDVDGKWVANIGTNKYDLHKIGQWQRLTATAETPLNAVRGQFALERGMSQAKTHVRLWLDDITLELLEGP